MNLKKNNFISPKNLNYYNLNFKNKLKIAQKIGLNFNQHTILIKQKHITIKLLKC